MSESSFIEPESERIPLSKDGEWIEVKKRLNTGEKRRQDCLAIVPIEVNGRIVDHVDPSMYEILLVELWLVKWSLFDDKGDVRPLSLSAIKALDPAKFDEIRDRLLAHITKQIRDKKKGTTPPPPNETNSSDKPTSPS
jgi:hypothetical protein